MIDFDSSSLMGNAEPALDPYLYLRMLKRNFFVNVEESPVILGISGWMLSIVDLVISVWPVDYQFVFEEPKSFVILPSGGMIWYSGSKVFIYNIHAILSVLLRWGEEENGSFPLVAVTSLRYCSWIA